MNTTQTDSRHQDWIAMEALAVKLIYVMTATILGAIAAFTVAVYQDDQAAFRGMQVLLMATGFIQLLVLTLAIWARKMRIRVEAQIKAENGN